MKLLSLPLLTLLAALASAGVAGVFSIFGMMAIFSGIPAVGASVGVVVELTKLMSVSFLYRYWGDKLWFRYPGLLLTLLSMLITSMGVYGMLTKAHTEQGEPVANNVAKIELLDQKIAREQSRITSNQNLANQLDLQVQKLIEFNKVSSKGGAKELRLSQKAERDAIELDIKESLQKIDALQEEKLQLGQVVRNFEAEIGPVKYIAELFYEDADAHIGSAIRIAIILIMLALDPMAIFLLMGYNHIRTRESSDMLSVASSVATESTVESLLHDYCSATEETLSAEPKKDQIEEYSTVNNEPLLDVDDLEEYTSSGHESVDTTGDVMINSFMQDKCFPAPTKTNEKRWFF